MSAGSLPVYRKGSSESLGFYMEVFCCWLTGSDFHFSFMAVSLCLHSLVTKQRYNLQEPSFQRSALFPTDAVQIICKNDN